ncbi:hypothetical protein [Paenibacillus pini]|nr:hypothetical protein [Paenibacillus pini]
MVDSCEIQQSENEKKLIYSSPITSLNVETLPYVSNINVVVHLKDIKINDTIMIELQIFNEKGEIIAFTEKNSIVANKNELKTYCKIQTVHCSEGEFRMVLFCNGEPSFEFNYIVLCEDKNIYFDEISIPV